MFRKIKTLCTKHRELFIYILVGGGTTAAAWGCKYLCNLFFFAGTAFPNAGQNSVLSIVENAAAIAYAYPANRKWVFHSTEPQILPELATFTGSRTAVWILGWLMNMLLVSVLNVNIFLSTLLVGIVGMVVNYSLSKLLVFHANGRKTQNYEPFKPDAVTAMHACKDVDIASAA